MQCKILRSGDEMQCSCGLAWSIDEDKPDCIKKSKCIICHKEFVEGDQIQAFLRSPNDPNGSWTSPVVVDSEFQQRYSRNKDAISRKHDSCVFDNSRQE